MPRLARFRLVSIGHRDARMNDLTLSFLDAQGRPTDSAIWLRNGGGKSSLLNLFFAVLRPGKSDFLGNRAGAKQRRLEHYVLPQDRAVTVCEWVLDSDQTLLDFMEGRKYLTGVFYERASSPSTDDGQLRRLFFSAPVSPQDGRLTLEGLPLFVEAEGGGSSRRTLSGFRQEWAGLRAAYPRLQLFATEIQREWADHLASLGIDPELFFYQVRMNLREGGAQDMFRFREHEDFADFLLQLVIDPAYARSVSENIGAFREHLSRRKDKLLPEMELTSGLLERTRPLLQVAERRGELRRTAWESGQRLSLLKDHVVKRIERLSRRAETLRARRDQNREKGRNARALAESQRKRAAAMRRFAARLELRKSTSRLAELETRFTKAKRMRALWNAAIPLRSALRFEDSARGWRERLEQRQEEHAPLLNRLKGAAEAYAASLRHHAHSLRKTQAEQGREARGARAEANNCRQYAAECKAQAATAEKEAEFARQRVEQCKAAHARLVEEGLLGPDESGSEAAERIGEQLRQHEEKFVELKQKRKDDEAQLRRLRQTKEDAIAQEAALYGRVEAGQRELDDAAGAKAEIEGSDVLRRALEAESLDLERLPDQTLTDLRGCIDKAVGEIVDLKIARAEAERAQSHLEATGLLPPSREMEHVLGELKKRLRAVWSGWEYIASNLPDSDSRRRLIGRLPQVASGVVVRDDDLQTVRGLVEKGESGAELPVVVSAQSSTLGDGSMAGVVVGPDSDGYFDRDAAHEELQGRRSAIEQSDEALREIEDWRYRLEDVSNRLRQFRRRYPVGWFGEQHALIDRAETELDEHRRRSRGLASELSDTERHARQCHEEEFEAQGAVSECRRSVEVVETYVAQHEAALEDVRKRLAEAEARIGQKRDEECAWKAEAQEADALSERTALAAQGSGEEARSVEAELALVGYLGEQEAAPRSGEVAALRDRYQQLKAQYEGQVGKEGLLQLAEQEEKHAAEERRKFERALTEGISEEEVNEQLVALESMDRAEEALARAEEEHTAAWSAHGNAIQATKRAKENAAKSEVECRKLSPVPELASSEEPAGILQAEDSAKTADKDADKADKRSSEHFAEADAAERELDRVKRNEDGLGKDMERLSGIAEDYEDILCKVEPIPEASLPWTPPDNDKDVGRMSGDIARALKGAREQDAALKRERRGVVHRVQIWARNRKFEPLNSVVARKFSEVDEEALEGEIAKWVSDLEVRLGNVEAQLAGIDVHREVLVKQLLDVAHEGLSLLRRAASQSRLPEHVPGMGGSQFLRINTHEPDDLAEKKGRIAELLDEIIDEGEVPSGVALVQKAVRRLARGVRVRVLHPDPDHDREYIDIPQMARFSGGEQLTSAILLYCALAQLRARARGISRSPTSVLVLDNPIGSSSRVRFLETQRAVARAMGVQLIYTTAVNDREALSTLPNIIRLRNERADRKSGCRVVEPYVPPDAGMLDGVRIARTETDPEALDSNPA